jgi:xylulose-5-phosphate/fructose-6-phosphate phosphoketolase
MKASKKTWMEGILKPEDADGGELDLRPRDGDAERAHAGRLVRRLRADRAARLLLELRGFRARHRLDVQPAREVAGEIEKGLRWRAPVSSLNLLITSLVWRQDHNGFTHQDPGFLDVVTNKSAEVTRIYLPPDANCLLSVADHCLRSRITST